MTTTVVTAYQYDEANRLISVNTLPGTGKQPYEWDETSITYRYNGDGARLQQIVNEASTTYAVDLAAPLPVVLQSQTDEVTTQYVYALGTRPLAQNSGTWEYLLADALGSVRQIVDGSGNIIVSFGIQPIAALVIGFIANNFGTANAILFNGVAMIVGGLLMLTLRTELRGWEAPRSSDPVAVEAA